MLTEQKIHSLITMPRMNPSDFINHFSHLGRLNGSNYNPQLFETIGNHSHVRCLTLTNPDPKRGSHDFGSFENTKATTKQINKLTMLSDSFGFSHYPESHNATFASPS